MVFKAPVALQSQRTGGTGLGTGSDAGSGSADCSCYSLSVSCCMKPQGPHPDGIDEGPSEEDVARFNHETVPCPACGTQVYDESEWCHKCGHAMVAKEASDSGPMSKKTMVVLVLILLAIGLLFSGAF